LGFVDYVGDVVGADQSLWAYVWTAVTLDYSCSTDEILGVILVRAGLQVIPAALLGWVL
jgi:hypothetical protein